jgi:hypothetical protein
VGSSAAQGRRESESEGGGPGLPSLLQTVAFEDFLELRPVKSGEFDQIDESGPILGPTHSERDGCKVFGDHDPEMMAAPLEVGGLLDGFCFETWRGGEELDRKSVDEKSFFVELVKTKFAQPVKDRVECDEQGPRFRFEKHEHIDVPGCQGFAMKTGGRGTADGIAGEHAFTQESFEDVTDGLHAFLRDSSWRVSRINWPMMATFS